MKIRDNKMILFAVELIWLLILFWVFPGITSAMNEGESVSFGATNNEQIFTAPVKGYYQLETWGAQGGYHGGYGAYSTGVVLLEEGQKLYINVGGSIPSQYVGGYNGGGNAWYGSSQQGYAGGGATHIATVSGLLKNLSNNRNAVLIVAAGGGGQHTASSYRGSHGGGYLGVNGYDTYRDTVGFNGYSGSGASLTAGGYAIQGGSNCGRGAFGQGGSYCNMGFGGYGGGGGWYGGGGSNRGSHGGGGGGSSYIGNEKLISYNNISKATYCYACSESTIASQRTISTTAKNSTATKNTAKTGAGYARITLNTLYSTPNLESITLSSGNLMPKFNSETYEYDVSIDSEISKVTINATPISQGSVITGIGEVNVPAGTTKYTIISTSTSGNIATYTINITRPKSSYSYLENIKIDGNNIVNFNSTTLTYEVNVPYTEEKLNIEPIKGRADQEVYLSDLSLHSGKNTVTITVISEDGNNTTEYILTVNRAHSSKLKLLEVSDYLIEPDFDPETLTYHVKVLAHTMSLSVTAEAYDEEASIKAEGFGYIKGSTIGKITVTEPNSSPTTYTINIEKSDVPIQTTFDYPYRGYIETFTPTVSAYYQLETWGSQGGGTGGYGAYSTGVVYLERGETIYIAVGGQPTSKYTGGYNGGGNAINTGGQSGNAGGGATHIAKVTGVLSSLENNKSSILIVAAGGGGAGNASYNGGHGGGFVGATAYDSWSKGYFGYTGTGGTLTAGGYVQNMPAYGKGSFGQGGNYHNVNWGGCGGGGGYYGGGGSNRGSHGGGGGGSSYVGSSELISYDTVTKGTYCYGCTASSVETQRTINTTNVNANPISNYAKKGAGYARISMLRIPSENNYLASLKIMVNGEEKIYTPTFDVAQEKYKLSLDVNETNGEIIAVADDIAATITGTGKIDIPAGTTTYPIVVTAENKKTRTYEIEITRPASDNPYPNNIEISGLIESLCTSNPIFCHVNPENFNKDTYDYELRVPGKIKQIWFNVEKGHPFQTITGDGRVELAEGDNNFTIKITSEDGEHFKEYHYKVIRDMSENANLLDIEIVDPERELDVKADVTEYFVSIPNEYDKINELKVTPADPNADVVVIGNEDFQVGTNQIIIIVTAVSGDEKVYFLNVYREKNDNTFLNNLKVVDPDDETLEYPLLPTFNKMTNGTYKVNVPNSVEKVKIIATPEAEDTIVEGDGTKTLTTGVNTYNITTTAESATKDTYTIEITRDKNNNPYLSNIIAKFEDTVLPLSPTFESETLNYDIAVSGNTTTIDITAIPEVSTTIYKLLDNNILKVGKNIKRVMAIAEDGTNITYTLNITRTASNDNYLKDIELSTGVLNPEFKNTTNAYEVIVENETSSITINGIKNDPRATVTGNGYYSLAIGTNEIMLEVTAEDGSIRTYTINVLRKVSNNAYLSNIKTSLGELEPEFKKETFEYTIHVDNTVEKITLQGIPENKKTIVAGNGEFTLTGGSNIFTLTTLAADKKTKLTYKVNVEKDASDNNNLSYLLLEEAAIDPEFNKDITEYHAKVPYAVERGSFQIQTEDENATYQIEGNEAFKVGENEVIITVTSESKKDKIYKIIIERQASVENSDFLISLETTKGTIVPSPFNKENQYYEIVVPYDTTELTLTATPEDPDATVENPGTITLETGKNNVNIRVISQDGKIRDYQVVITREESDEARLQSMIIDGVLSPGFNKDVFEYFITTSETSLTFDSLIAMEEKATIQVFGNEFDEMDDYDVIIRVTSPSKKVHKEYILHVTKEASNNNNLASLEVEGFTITPEFNKATTLYYTDVESNINSIVVEAIPESSKATVEGDGLQILNTGTNQITIEVTSESGKVKAYTIIVTRNGNSNNKLLDLTVNNGIMTPEFSQELNNYDVLVENTEDYLDLSVILESDKATYSVVNNHLIPGTNKVSVIVTSEDGNINTYILNVIRKEVVNALLENITITNYRLSPQFNRYLNNYDLLINYESEKLEFTITPEDQNATWQIEGMEEIYTGTQTIELPNIPLGSSQIKIQVTSSDGEQKETYSINIRRQNIANDFLNYLYTSEGELTPIFKQKIMDYSITVGSDVKEIELFGEPASSSSIVEGLGIHSLSPGVNELAVTITTDNGIKRVYYIEVIRSKKTSNNLESLNVKNGFTEYPLNPDFAPEKTEYTVNVPMGTHNVTIEGTVPESATVEGLGIKDLKSGTNTFEIVVTSEAGETKTYKINVIRESDTNNHLISIIPSIGELTPTFGYDETNYELHLDDSASTLSFEVVTESLFATVTGTESQIVPDGISRRTITVHAEDGEERIYTITVYKERKDNAKLSSLSVNGYEFDIPFNKDTFEYHIIVPNSKKVLFQSDVLAVTEDENATIKKSENLNLSTTSENVFIVTVTAPDGFTKQIYKIYIEREKGNNALLNNLEVKVGSLSTVFTPEKFEYDWAVPRRSKTDITDILPTPQDANATIEIRKEAEKQYIIKVTSEDESVTNEYKLTLVISLIGDNTELESLIPSAGELEYSNDITEYELVVPEETENISFEAITVDPDATITGIEETPLEYGENDISIIVTAADGQTTRNIKIKVIRPKSLISIIPSEEAIVLDMDEVVTINYTLNPEETTYTGVHFESEDATIAAVDQSGTIVATGYGITNVKIISDHDESITAIIRVDVIRKHIISKVLDIKRHTEEEYEETPDAQDYIIGLDAESSVNDFKSKLENRSQFIHVYNLDGEEVEGETIIGNGFVVKLICEGKMYDELVIIVRGDLNGDSHVNITDYVQYKTFLLGKITFTYIENIAADLNNDNIPNITDYVIMKTYLLGKISSLND